MRCGLPDDSEIVDIRPQRGGGADAVDSLNKFYGLKVPGDPIPDQIRLTNVEVQKALSADDYFLVLFGNVEAGAGAPEVRIIDEAVEQFGGRPRTREDANKEG